MEQELKRKTMVIGYKNPDTDSICSTICYANLKQTITGNAYTPARIGRASGETGFVLDYFGVGEPKLVEDVRTQVRGIEIRKTRRIADNISLKKAWSIMQENNVVTIPSIRPDGTLEGPITADDIIETYMNIHDSSILPKAHTQYSNIIETLEADIVVGDADIYFDKRKALAATANPDLIESHIGPYDLAILGDRYESQLYAIKMGADCVIVCEGTGVSMTIKKIAQDRGCTVIAITYDTYTVAHLINQSMPVSYFMTKEHLITSNSDDHTGKIRKVTASKRCRDFPILDKGGRHLGIISRQNLLDARGKQVILVDHNEGGQIIADIKSAETVKIIDRHKLGTVQTMALVFFRSRPLGCTAIIVYQMYLEDKMNIEPKIAGLLCSAIVSDTLLPRSPTCTPVDEAAAGSLAVTVGLDIEKYAMEMSGAESDLKDKSDEKIFYQDSKKSSADKALIGVGQITSLNDIELETLKEKMLGYMEKAKESNSLDMVFFMLANMPEESTDLICYGQGAMQLAVEAFHPDTEEATEKPEPAPNLPGVVPRKR